MTAVASEGDVSGDVSGYGRQTDGVDRRGALPPVSAAPSGRRGSGLRRLGAHFVIAPAGADDAPLASALAGLRPDPDALLVLAAAADAAPVLRASLARLAGLARERGASVLVLAASGLAPAAPGAAGRRPAERGLPRRRTARRRTRAGWSRSRPVAGCG